MANLVRVFVLVGAVLGAASPAFGQKVLFDARHGQTAGQADWIVDADSSQLRFKTYRCEPSSTPHHSAQRFPTPPQSEIRLDTPETFWSGGISAWAMDLAKDALNPARGRSWQIEQYPWDAPPMTFGDPANPQDLSGYDVLILCEPNIPYDESEIVAIRRFVEEGGGLFLIADHETSDRDCSGGPGGEKEDSPFILNRLMGTRVDTDAAPPYFDPSDPDHDFGLFGIWFYENGNDDEQDEANRRFDWFTEAVDKNVSTDPADPIVNGPFGSGLGGLGFFGSTQIAVATDPERGNPTARGHVWRMHQSQLPNAAGVSERVTLASAQFGRGRVVAVGDSSPADDGTGQGSLHDGWDKAEGGVENDVLFLNATEWLAGVEADTRAPSFESGPTAEPGDCHATIAWTADEPARGDVSWGESPALPQHAASAGTARAQEVTIAPLAAETLHHFQVAVTDAAGNGPTPSAVLSFRTAPRRAPRLLAEPEVVAVTDRGAVVRWRTDEPGTSVARFGSVPGADLEVRDPGPNTAEHELDLGGLEPATSYTVEVETADACGETVRSARVAFTTVERPREIEIGGWKLQNDLNPEFEYTFPPGTKITAGGYLVIGRDSDRASFEAEWGPLDPAVGYLDAGDEILVNGTARRFRLVDASGAVIDGFGAAVRKNQSQHRRDGCSEAAVAWTDRPAASGDPGRGAPAACGAGVIVTEVADGRAFPNEFVELGFDSP